MKKKPFEIQRWMWMIGLPSLFGVVLLFSRTVVTFADMPKRVDTIEQYITAQQEANRIQAKANELLMNQMQKQQPYCEQDSQNITWCWDEHSRQWYKENR